jgi:hypothetical protein
MKIWRDEYFTKKRFTIMDAEAGARSVVVKGKT